MKKITTILTRALIALVILAILAGAGGTFYFKSHIPSTAAQKSFPQIDGELRVPGLENAVDIYRDEMGIPAEL